jgi:hypothetical protein
MNFTMVVIGGAIGLLAGSGSAADNVSPDVAIRLIVRNYGTCAVKAHPARASEAVLANVEYFVLKTKYHDLVDSNCLPSSGRLALPGDTLKYALADALVTRQLISAPVPNLSAVPPLERPPLPPFAEIKRKYGYDVALSATYQAPMFAALDQYGECVVRKTPANSWALLMTAPASSEERSQFEALVPALSECAPEGRTVQFDKLQLRGTIALNYYRLAQTALHLPIR